MRRTAKLLILVTLAAAPFLAACNGECVRNCSEPDDDDDDSAEAVDDDDSAEAVDYREGAGREVGDEWESESTDAHSCEPHRIHLPPGSPQSVSIAGEWNNWKPTPMEGPDSDGWWLARLPDLPPGDYAYKYLYDEVWEGAPPPWAWAKWVEGTENRALRHGDCSTPLLRHQKTVTTPEGTITVTFEVVPGSAGATLDAASVVATFGAQPASVSWLKDQRSLQFSAQGLPPGKHSLLVEANDSEGRPLEGTPAWLPLWVETQPFVWNEALIYSVFIDRFRNGDHDQPPLFDPIDDVDWNANYQGGDLLGVLHALQEDYFEDLGVDVLWLSPVQENPEGAWLARDGIHNFSGFHGYWPTDPFAIEERFGDAEMLAASRLAQVIEEAHSRGIRVMLDLVLNHVHQEHVYLDQHPEWFGEGCTCGAPGCDWEEHRLDCWFMDYLPDLNHRNHELMSHVVDDSMTLLRQLDVDGVRIDAAKHMDHVVMRRLSRLITERVEQVGGARLPLIGETFTGSDGHDQILDYVSEYELDGQFDFPLYWPIRQTFAGGQSFTLLDDAVEEGLIRWGDALMSPFAGNHDVMRIATEMAGNDDGAWGATSDLLAGGGNTLSQDSMIRRLAMAHAFTMTQNGAPLLYYGDEIGLAGSDDPDNRRMMNFAPYLSANQEALLSRVRGIGQARANHKALRGGTPTTLWVDDDLFVYGLLAEDGQQAVVALNKGESARSESVPVAFWGLADQELGDTIDPTRSTTVQDGALSLELGPLDYVFLTP